MKTYLFISVAAVALAACDKQPEAVQYVPVPQPVQPAQQQAAQPAPIIVQQPAQSSGGSDMITGMIAGHLLTNALGGARAAPAPAPVVINRTYVTKTIVQAPPPAVAPKPAPAPRAAPAPAPRPAPAPSRSGRR